MVDDAYDFVKEEAANEGVFLFVGTKKQAQDAIAEESVHTYRAQYFVNRIWLGGTLTNWDTIQKLYQTS